MKIIDKVSYPLTILHFEYSMFNKDRIEKIKNRMKSMRDAKLIEDSVWKNYEESFGKIKWNWSRRIGYFQQIGQIRNLENVKKENQDILDLEWVLFDSKFGKWKWKKVGKDADMTYPRITYQTVKEIQKYAEERASKYDSKIKEIVKNMIKTIACHCSWGRCRKNDNDRGYKTRKIV